MKGRLRKHKRSLEIENQGESVDQATPEQELLIAMIKQAVIDLESSDGDIWLDAHSWLMGKDNREWSFAWCCNQLVIEPETIWARL